ncbi:unnamed protein product [Adineta ricciae]|uniref:HIG1 domain-containing protein n=1 Tax=Adineta ricciae TaxID=249248 RepID=A0A813ZLM7_ADIRI|nr:unnamed protein product [Adineta ricciae]CAF0901313.1 unnamed protein product [Adineta ricciae]
MGKDDDNLEYYKAKQKAGQSSVSKPETKTSSKPVATAKTGSLQSSSAGYIAMKDPKEKEREFERYKEITFAQKASDRAKKNPLVPIGLLATVAALTLGLRAVSRGDRWQSQMMMRARIGAQGFTILAVLASIMYAGQSQGPVDEPSPPRRSSSSSASS